MTSYPWLALWAIIADLGFIGTPSPAQDFVFKNHGAKGTLVELYSSEGCSSCPPAEAWLSKLKASPDLWTNVFPVAFHVDYWDGLGWPDRFARAAYTTRQRNYAAQLGQDSVYTPEFVVNGREWRGWFDGRPLSAAQVETTGELMLSGEVDGKNLSATYSPTAKGPAGPYAVNVALLVVGIASEVSRGENGGRTLEHDFVVLAFGSQPLSLAKAQHFESAPFALASSTGDAPKAAVAWVSAGDGSLAQITGGWLK